MGPVNGLVLAEYLPVPVDTSPDLVKDGVMSASAEVHGWQAR